MLHKPVEERIQLLQVLGVGGGVEQQVVNVDNHIGQAMDHSFHKPLEAGRSPEQSH